MPTSTAPRQHYVRHFPSDLWRILGRLEDREIRPYLRLCATYAECDGDLPADSERMAEATGQTVPAWLALRDKLIAARLGRIDGDKWVDESQDRNFEKQRNASKKGRKAGEGRWGHGNGA